jgi:23S rRNA pseudouridine1911/1915/1917 synthase
VDNKPFMDRGFLTHYLKKDSYRNKSFVTSKKDPEAKISKLEYKTVGKFGDFWLLRIKLHTGRHHQIRVQLNHIGCRIVGDIKYGFSEPNSDKSICLHCHTIEFIHPVSKEQIRITADLPHIPEWDIIRDAS